MVIPGYIENLQSCDLKFWISPSMVILPVFAFNVSSILCHSPGNILWWLQNKFQRHQNFMPLITEQIPSDKGRPELLARNLTLKFTNQSYRLRFYIICDSQGFCPSWHEHKWTRPIVPIQNSPSANENHNYTENVWDWEWQGWILEVKSWRLNHWEWHGWILEVKSLVTWMNIGG